MELRFMRAAALVRENASTLRGVPELLQAHPAQAQIVHTLLATVEGQETDAVPQCGILWKAGVSPFSSAVFLGGRWALTAGHAVADRVAADYHVTLPAAHLFDMRPSNCFHVADIIPGPAGADLALLSLASSGLAPNVDPSVKASPQEIAAAPGVQVCGFGADDCNNQAAAGVKRISRALPVVANPAAKAIPVNPAFEFAADDGGARPVTCDSDSGGGVFVTVGSGLKLAGIIRGTAPDAQGNAYTLCVQLEPVAAWIRQVTGLSF